MGTLEEGPIWAHRVLDPVDVLKQFGWEENTTPAQLQASLAYCADARANYLVDRHDEIAAGFGELLSRHTSTLEMLVNALEETAKSVQNIAAMLDRR